jgi:hypothetical protein
MTKRAPLDHACRLIPALTSLIYPTTTERVRNTIVALPFLTITAIAASARILGTHF